MTAEGASWSQRMAQALFDDATFDKTVEAIFEHVYESYQGDGKSGCMEVA